MHLPSFQVVMRILFITLVVVVGTPVWASGEDGPVGLQVRIPWNSSKLLGSPEPPLDYTVARTFTKLSWVAPIYVADEPGTDRLWVIQVSPEPEKGSRIVRITDDPDTEESEDLLDMPKKLAYSVCFHPQYATNGYVYVFSNSNREEPVRHNRITRYTVDRQPPGRIVSKSEQMIIEWKSAGHDGGEMVFGVDGMLYITTGDGTSDSDTLDSGQTLNDLLGSVLRIDVDHPTEKKAYSIPKDNPFVDTTDACPEIWAYGLRNPWRMAIDRKTGHIWVGNNGQDHWETAYLLERGANYGWSIYEGNHPFYLGRKKGPTPRVAPTIEHSHAEFRSLTGGVVYYGDKHPALNGAYVYGDFATGRIWGMKHDGRRVIWHRELADTTLQITAFRVDQRGDLLVVDNGGGIYRLVPMPKTEPGPAFPTRLSETGLFAFTKTHQVKPGLISFSVVAPGWADGASADRFMAIPGLEKVGFDSNKGWNFPNDTALVQTLSMEHEPGNPASRFRVETRLFLRHLNEWEGYSYLWNKEQTDATLVDKGGQDLEISIGNTTQKWRIPSRVECTVCHSRAVNFALGVTGSQLDRDHNYGGTTANQLRTLDHIGLFDKPLGSSKDRDKLVDPRDPRADLEQRARSYLNVNCSGCHVDAGGGNAKMLLSFATPREKMNLIGARPQHDTFGISNAMLIAPGAPERSVLIHRLEKRGTGQMPPLVSNRVDDEAIKLLSAWIAQLKPELPFVQAWDIDDFLPIMNQLNSGRSIDAGRKAFRETGCIQCHRIEGEGGSVGPDLGGIARRQKDRDLLESILIPSKLIADEYATALIEMTDESVIIGRVEREDDQVVVIRPPASSEVITVDKSKIVQRRKSELSNMPLGTVNVLAKDQVLDLIAYLLSDPQPKKPDPE